MSIESGEDDDEFALKKAEIELFRLSKSRAESAGRSAECD
jgi:hypothetical protein